MDLHKNYTIPRNNRELQHELSDLMSMGDYTIPRNNRELQPRTLKKQRRKDYTIPRNNRELQPPAGYFHTLSNYTIPRNNRELYWNHYPYPKIKKYRCLELYKLYNTLFYPTIPAV